MMTGSTAVLVRGKADADLLSDRPGTQFCGRQASNGASGPPAPRLIGFEWPRTPNR